MSSQQFPRSGAPPAALGPAPPPIPTSGSAGIIAPAATGKRDPGPASGGARGGQRSRCPRPGHPPVPARAGGAGRAVAAELGEPRGARALLAPAAPQELSLLPGVCACACPAPLARSALTSRDECAWQHLMELEMGREPVPAPAVPATVTGFQKWLRKQLRFREGLSCFSARYSDTCCIKCRVFHAV